MRHPEVTLEQRVSGGSLVPGPDFLWRQEDVFLQRSRGIQFPNQGRPKGAQIMKTGDLDLPHPKWKNERRDLRKSRLFKIP